MSNINKILIGIAAILAGCIIAMSINLAYSEPVASNLNIHVKTNFENQLGQTFLGSINNTGYTPVTVTEIYLEVYDWNHNLIGYVSQYENIPLPPNGSAVWKLMVTNSDVPDIKQVGLVMAGLNYQ